MTDIASREQGNGEQAEKRSLQDRGLIVGQVVYLVKLLRTSTNLDLVRVYSLQDWRSLVWLDYLCALRPILYHAWMYPLQD